MPCISEKVLLTTNFGALGVPTALIGVLAARDITTPTPIQAATLPDSLAGRDVLGRGRTGSGKTYAFGLALVARLSAGDQRRTPGRPRGLVLVPTRELALQIEEALTPLAAATGLTTRTVFGGVGQHPQVNALKKGVDIVIACPGRLEDLMAQGHVKLDRVQITVLDEADHMADLGFLPGVRRILGATDPQGQRLLFSATLDSGVNALAKQFLHAPITHEADSAQSPVATMAHHVLQLGKDDHLAVLADLAAAPGRTIVFTRTKHRAKRIARQLNSRGVAAVELHGNLSQNARVRTMEAFRSGSHGTLVATDIAARGVHVDEVSLVIHADPPAEHKAYVHRSGRTARAGQSGTVVTLALDEQLNDVRGLARKAGIRPTYTRVNPRSDLLQELAPGKRVVSSTPIVAPGADEGPREGRRPRPQGRGSGAGRPGRNGSRTGSGKGPGGQSRAGQSRNGQSRNGQARSGQGKGRGRSRATSAA